MEHYSVGMLDLRTKKWRISLGLGQNIRMTVMFKQYQISAASYKSVMFVNGFVFFSVSSARIKQET